MIPTPGSWDKLRYHLLHIWCRDNEADFHYLMSWFALLVQYPDEKPATSLIISGGKGSGKSIIMAAIFEPIFNHRYCDMDLSDINAGRFSPGCLDKHLVVYDGSLVCGDMNTSKRVQDLLSKVSFIMLTNDNIEPHSYAKISTDFFALSLDNEKTGDSKYFGALIAEINNGGREAFLYDLLHYETKV